MQPLFARASGTGEVLLLLHGFCETSMIWDDLRASLSLKYKVIALDLPGFGASALPASAFSIADIADQVMTWLYENHLPPLIVLGHSLGGYVALSMAKHHESYLTGIGLINSTVFADSEEKKANRNKTIEFVKRNGVKPFIETFVPGLFADKADPAIPFVHRIASDTRQETLVAYAAAMRDRPDQLEFWQNTTLPKLLVYGGRDTIVPVEISRKMTVNAGNLKYWELPETAHMGFLEAKEECLAAISGFASSLP